MHSMHTNNNANAVTQGEKQVDATTTSLNETVMSLNNEIILVSLSNSFSPNSGLLIFSKKRMTLNVESLEFKVEYGSLKGVIYHSSDSLKVYGLVIL